MSGSEKDLGIVYKSLEYCSYRTTYAIKTSNMFVIMNNSTNFTALIKQIPPQLIPSMPQEYPLKISAKSIECFSRYRAKPFKKHKSAPLIVLLILSSRSSTQSFHLASPPQKEKPSFLASFAYQGVASREGRAR